MMWLGTPCSTFSLARRGPAGGNFPSPLRSASEPMGLSTLEGKDLEKVQEANDVAEKAAELLDIAIEMNVPSGEENPWQSRLWLTPSRSRLLSLPCAVQCILDQCAFGTPWRARARLVFWNTGSLRTFKSCRCANRGKYIFSQKPHVVLSSSVGGLFATRLKAAYPVKMYQKIAGVLSSAANGLSVAARWNIMKGSQGTA